MIKRVFETIGVIFLFAIFLLAYNAFRHLIFWGPTETITYNSGDATIVCTFAKPADAGVFPAVSVLLGSGRETRSGPAYRINASNMLRHGFAILICDKRGSGDSSGNFEVATFAEFAEDAKEGVAWLARRDDIDDSRIGLLANSESGWFSAQVAAETDQVAFIINRVGPPLPWMDTVLWESRNEFLQAGFTETEVDELLATTRRRWSFYADVGNDPTLSDSTERSAIDAELAGLRQTIPRSGEVLPEQARAYDQDFYRSYAIDATYEPEHYLRQIDVPLLYVFGGRDVNIPTEQSVAFLNSFKNQYPAAIDIRVYPQLGHAMATLRGLFHGGYPPDYLSFVGAWAQDQVSR